MSRNNKDFETKRQNNVTAFVNAEDLRVSDLLRAKTEKEEAEKVGAAAYYIRKKTEAEAQLIAQNSAPVTSGNQVQFSQPQKAEQQNSSQISAAESQYFQQLSREIYAQVFGGPLPSFRRTSQRKNNKAQQTTSNQTTAATANVLTVTTQVQTNPTLTSANNGTAEQPINVVSTFSQGSSNNVEDPDYHEADSNNNYTDDSSHRHKNSTKNGFQPEFQYSNQEEDQIRWVKDQLHFDKWVETNEILNGHRGNKDTFVILNQRVNSYLCELTGDARLMFKFRAFSSAMATQQDHQLAFHRDLRGFADDLEQAYQTEVDYYESFVPLSKNQYILTAEDARYRQPGDNKEVYVTQGLGMSFAQEE